MKENNITRLLSFGKYFDKVLEIKKYINFKMISQSGNQSAPISFLKFLKCSF